VQFDAIDENGDDKIDIKEYMAVGGNRKNFDKLDKDGDGFIDKEELGIESDGSGFFDDLSDLDFS
jgi:hypothetical protein